MRLKNLSQADRFCAQPSSDPYWNESSWFSFSIPERKFHGMIYYFFRPNMNRRGRTEPTVNGLGRMSGKLSNAGSGD